MISVDGVLLADARQFIDYACLEGDANYRADQKTAFVGAEIWTPAFDYPALTTLYDDPDTFSGTSEDTDIPSRKRELQESVFALVHAADSGDIDSELAEMYAGYYEYQLKKIMLVEAARAMTQAGDGEQHRTARETFMRMNREVYSEMNVTDWKGIMATEKRRAQAFAPQNETATSIKNDLEYLLGNVPEDVKEVQLLRPELVELYRPFIEEKYEHIFAEIPNTPDDVYYDANDCAVIINWTIAAGKLEGWVCEVHPTKTAPATNAEKKRIYLPKNTRRNASELRRLVLHEQEVHARRGFNGERNKDALPLLEIGTADYADVEEGLGVFLEMILAGTDDNPAVNRARDRYITAGLIMGLDTDEAAPRDARQTYETLWRIIAIRKADQGRISEADVAAAKKEATTHIENAFRGTPFAAPGVFYTKLKVYYEGLIKNVRRFEEIASGGRVDAEKFDAMFVGKHNHVSEDEHNLVLGIIA